MEVVVVVAVVTVVVGVAGAAVVVERTGRGLRERLWLRRGGASACGSPRRPRRRAKPRSSARAAMGSWRGATTGSVLVEVGAGPSTAVRSPMAAHVIEIGKIELLKLPKNDSCI